MYRKILVPLDGSQLSQCVLPGVRILARSLAIPEVVVLRVVEPLPEDVRNGLVELGGEQILLLERKRRKEADDYVNSIAKDLRGEGIQAVGSVIEGRAAEEIINYAEKNQIDLIIMSTHGRSGNMRLTMGGVALKVVNYAKTPVQTVSTKDCIVRGGC